MAFIPLKTPRTRGEYSGDKIRISFPKLRDQTVMIMYIGHDIANKLGLKDKDRVMLYTDEVYPLVWKVAKEDRGWKLNDVNKNRPHGPKVLKLQVSWSKEIPGDCDNTIKFVNWDLYEGGIRLFIPGMDQEQQKTYVKETYAV